MTTDAPQSVPAAGQVPLLNVANALTALRLLLVPLFAWIVVMSEMTDPWWRTLAAVVFCVASVTDYIDGWVARSRNLVTSFGKVADPIADKALTGTALVMLSGYDLVWWWVTIVILAREIGITLMRFWVLRYGVIAASRGGKLKTALQVLAIVWYLGPWPEPLELISPWLMGAALIATVVTGLDYILRAFRLRRNARRDKAAAEGQAR